MKGIIGLIAVCLSCFAFAQEECLLPHESGMVEKVDLVILGSGPAGLTAAIYAGRSNLAPLVVEGDQPGGQLTITNVLENFPGFAEGTHAPSLMQEMRKQAEKFGAQFWAGKIILIEQRDSYFELLFDSKKKIRSRSLIVATGARTKWLNIPSEQRLIGKGVSSCATCDGFFFKKKDIVVVGGGDVALEEAIFLTKFANVVHVVVRSNKLRASKIMQDRAMANPKINFIFKTQVIDILGEGAVTAVVLLGESNATQIMPVDGVFVAIGLEPRSHLFTEILEIDESGYIKVQDSTAGTSVQGIFAAGDVADPLYRQAVTAAASGCKAALDAQRYLEGL